MRVRLPFLPPLRPDNLFGHLAATAIPGVEEWRHGAYRRTLRLPHGAGTVALAPASEHVDCRLRLDDRRDVDAAMARCRRLLDLDRDPVTIDGHLRLDPVLRPLVDDAPGRRVPGTVDPEEMAVRALLGQQVSTAAARTHAARLARAHGNPLADPEGGLTHLWPTPGALAGLDPEALRLPRRRRATLQRLVAALADGAIELGPVTDPVVARHRLLALEGIGPWTVEVIAMRALGDPDAFPATDLGVIRAAAGLGLTPAPGGLAARSAPWSPWRAYAVQHLWATTGHAVNRMPA